MSNVLVEKNKSEKVKENKMLMDSSNQSVKGKKHKSAKNLLTLIPIRTCKWSRQKKNPKLIRILKPRFDTRFGKKFGKRFNIKSTYNVNLDEYGTAVWWLMDGKQTVREIGEILMTQFGDSVEPLYPRLAAFLRILESNNLIILKTKRPKKKIKKV